MDLVLLVYGISLLDGLGKMGVFFAFTSGIVLVVSLMVRATECSEASYYSDKENAQRRARGVTAIRFVKWAAGILITSMLFLTLLPTQKTAYMMVGAYAAQKVAENDKVQATGSKVLELIDQKLQSYIEDGEEEIRAAAQKAADKAADKALRSKREE